MIESEVAVWRALTTGSFAKREGWKRPSQAR